MSRSDIFCFWYQVRYWKRKSATATIAMTATTAPMILSASVRASGRIADGSVRSSAMIRSRSGHISTVSTVPSTRILTMPLMRLATACMENMRLSPAIGEILESLGTSAWVDHTSRCWITLPANAANISSSTGTANAANNFSPIVW